MHKIVKSILLPYTPAELFDVVNDVEKYPEFMPWCGGSQVRTRDETGLTASITIAFGGLTQSFTTRNENAPPGLIRVHLVDGPFEALHGTWEFTALGDVACKVIFDLEYAFKNFALETLVGPVFGKIANTFVDSFAKRAETLYGPRP